VKKGEEEEKEKKKPRKKLQKKGMEISISEKTAAAQKVADLRLEVFGRKKPKMLNRNSKERTLSLKRRKIGYSSWKVANRTDAHHGSDA